MSRIVAIAVKSPNTSAGILHCKELLELRIPILKNLYDIRFLIKRPKPITINARATSSTVTQILQNLNDGENLNTETNNFDDITTVLKDKNQKKNTISEGNIENDSLSLNVNKDLNVYQKSNPTRERKISVAQANQEKRKDENRANRGNKWKLFHHCDVIPCNITNYLIRHQNERYKITEIIHPR